MSAEKREPLEDLIAALDQVVDRYRASGTLREQWVAREISQLLMRIIHKSLVATTPAHLVRTRSARPIDEHSRRRQLGAILRNEIIQFEAGSSSMTSASGGAVRDTAKVLYSIEQELVDLLMSIRLAVRGAGDSGAPTITGDANAGG
jgi:predicted neutral ceramidase superfamily lipid hydrolase